MEFRLPRLMVIADGFTEPLLYEKVVELASSQVLPWVQLRNHWASTARFRRRARAIVDEIRSLSPSTLISVNGDTELAAELGTGVHLGFRSIAPADARSKLGPETIIGYSAHADSHMSTVHFCHYITFSPVYPVEKARSVPPLGLERVAHVAALSPKPVFALGSITPQRVSECLEAGAHGVAVLSGIMLQDDPVRAAAGYLEALDAVAGIA